MRIKLTSSISGQDLNRLSGRMGRRLGNLRRPVHAAMADQFRQCTYDNLGAGGIYRPHPWAPLSAAYARIVKRSYATLFVSGILKAAIKSRANDDYGRVSVSKNDCEYALAHQFGVPEKHLPDRPYFPIHKNGKIVNAVVDLVVKAGKLAVKIALR